MLSFLFCFSFSVDLRYSIVTPIEKTNLSEVGNWSLKGKAISMKKHIRLTSAIPDQFGAVCQRVPTVYKNWVADFELRSLNGNGGNLIFFYFTKELCPYMEVHYTGFAIWINASKQNSNGESPIYFEFSNDSIVDFEASKPRGYVKLHGQKTPLRLRVTRSKGKVSVENFADQLFSAEFPDSILDMGYISIEASTNNLSYDDNDLVSFRFFQMSPEIPLNFSGDISAFNRKVLDTDLWKRRARKEVRRSVMQLTTYYSNDRKNRKDKLTGKGDGAIIDAFSLISEAEVRAKEMISKDRLIEFIAVGLTDIMLNATQTINKAYDRYDETKDYLQTMWQNLKTVLSMMIIQSKMEMERLVREAMQFAYDMKLADTPSGDKIFPENDTKKQESLKNVSKHEKRLYFICLVELIAYVIFFLYKHKKTKGFKMD